MMNEREDMMYDYMVMNGIATPNELNLAFNLVDGNWTEVLERVLYIRTGYRTFEQVLEEDEEE